MTLDLCFAIVSSLFQDHVSNCSVITEIQHCEFEKSSVGLPIVRRSGVVEFCSTPPGTLVPMEGLNEVK